jgi:hypothetical protein
MSDPNTPSGDVVFPPYVVAAASRRLSPSRLSPDPRKPEPDRYVPLGVRHAVASGADSVGDRRSSLCGLPMTGWFMFVNLEFTGSDPADCHRCEQLLRAQRRHGPSARQVWR